MMQMAGQISLFDFLSESAPLGWTKGIKMGQVIPFQDLKKYIGKRVVYATHMGNGNPVSKVVIIKKYVTDCDTYYALEENGEAKIYNDFVRSLSSKEKAEKMKIAFMCDRIGYTDDDRTKKTNCWLSEAYCTNGRHLICHDKSAVCFYEYKAM